MSRRYPKLQKCIGLILAGSLLAAAGCEPRPYLAFPEPENEAPLDIETVVEDLSYDNRIRVRLAQLDSLEARFMSLETDSLVVKELYWKKGLFGTKTLEMRDASMRIAVADIQQMHIYRHSTSQKVLIGVGVAALVGLIVIDGSIRGHK